MNRRSFLTLLAGVGGAAGLGAAPAAAAGEFKGHEDGFGVLHDATLCIGCRRCEAACAKVNDLPAPERPFTDLNVLNSVRRTSATAWTVVNKYEGDNGKPVFRKSQCYHCPNPPAPAPALSGRSPKTRTGR